ncbi:DinB family protein [Sporosarcina aquimarina]|uniref:DinB family protein n=1 Tax=Sporosarcina aquimarina TaxID=114975 RepID=UPI001C8E1D9F|nr:DinB family protein [Sporosarcina aquimarina]MBY0223587.1 DinB family protein [Sporosarcina aquimarina]
MKINDQAREELWTQVGHLTDEDINRKPSDNEWSIKQVLEHLYLMESGVIKTIQAQLTSGEQKDVADKPIELTVNRSTKVQAPEFATATEESATLEELKAKLNATHSTLREFAESTSDAQLEEKSYPHPVFGEMNLKQWIPFIGYHELRHIDQIKEVKQKLGL